MPPPSSASSIRSPGALGWTVIVLAFLVGCFTGGAPVASPGNPADSYSGWLFLFVPIAFGFGFILVPIFARAMERDAALDWSRYVWTMSGLAPLALCGAAFAFSVLRRDPDWEYLVYAACPLGISLGLAFGVSPLESGKNLL